MATIAEISRELGAPNSFLEQGIDFRPVQGNTSFTGIRGTVQGMHFRRAPKADAKLVRCMGVEYVPDLYAGFRYDDSMIGIPWPETVAALSANDAAGHC